MRLFSHVVSQVGQSCCRRIACHSRCTIPASNQSEKVDVALVSDFFMSLVTAGVILLAQMPQPMGATQFRNLRP